jgi:phenylacetate-CoA ligase
MDVRSAAPPASHGQVAESQTSGSTGQPVRFQRTAVTQLMWHALTLRHYSWHLDDFGGRLCAIRPQQGAIKPDSQEIADWGNPFRLLFKTGSSSIADCRQDTPELLDWLSRQNADYLLSIPSTLEAMARASPYGLPGGVRLKKVISYAETLKPEVRSLIQNAWNVPVADMYSSQEVGYIGLQCPQSNQYHIQSESLLVEILDAQSRPCQPGEIGKVVLTSLLNFASPLIRYEIQDYAEVGSDCVCGRGLPTINRIMGRVRNLIALPDGGRTWPVMDAGAWIHIAPIRQLQLVQKTPRLFHAHVLIDRELSAQEKTELTEAFRGSLGYSFDFEFHYLKERIVNPNGKFESIISEVSTDQQS